MRTLSLDTTPAFLLFAGFLVLWASLTQRTLRSRVILMSKTRWPLDLVYPTGGFLPFGSIPNATLRFSISLSIASRHRELPCLRSMAYASSIVLLHTVWYSNFKNQNRNFCSEFQDKLLNNLLSPNKVRLPYERAKYQYESKSEFLEPTSQVQTIDYFNFIQSMQS